MFGVVQAYIESKLTELNNNFDTAVKVNKINNDFELDSIAASNADINWQLYVPEFEYVSENESLGWFSLTARLEFFFNIAGKDNTIYQAKMDDYIYPIAKSIAADMQGMQYQSAYNDNIRLLKVASIGMSNGDRFDEQYFNPSLDVTISGYDYTFTTRVLSNDNTIA